jgi:hypothetical protein
MVKRLVLQRAEKAAELATEYEAKIAAQKKRAEYKEKEKARLLVARKQEAFKQQRALARKKKLLKLRHLKILDLLLAAACDGRSTEDISNLSIEDIKFLKCINANVELSFKRQMSNAEYKKHIKTAQSCLCEIDSKISWYRRSGVTLNNQGRYTPQIWRSRHPGVPNPYANYPPEEAWWRCHRALQSNTPPTGATLNLLNMLHKEMNSSDDYSLQLKELQSLERRRNELYLSVKRLTSDFDSNLKDDIDSVHTIAFTSVINTEKLQKWGIYDPIWINWIAKVYGGRQFIRALTNKITAEVKRGRRILSLCISCPKHANRKKYKTLLYQIGHSRQQTEGPPLDILERVCRLYGYRLSMLNGTPDSVQISW